MPMMMASVVPWLALKVLMEMVAIVALMEAMAFVEVFSEGVEGGRGGRGAMAYYSRKKKSADPSLHHYGELVGVTMILKDIGFDLEKLIVSLSKESVRFE
ncbi:hypothetical protein Droror1_Dr00009093 [Drosera rotundifolia]